MSQALSQLTTSAKPSKSASLSIEPINYVRDSAAYFELIKHLPKAVFLDSSIAASAVENRHIDARFDILSAQPLDWIEISSKDASQQSIDQIKNWYKQHQISVQPENPEHTSLPFLGGIIAGFSYELGQLSNNIFSDKLINTKEQAEFPLFFAGFYNWCIVQDHTQKNAYFVSLERNLPQEIRYIKQSLKETSRNKNEGLDAPSQNNLKPSLSKQGYFSHIDKIHEYILSGDCYQINYAQHYIAPLNSDPWSSYLHLRKAAQAPFSCFWDCGNQQILCASPERFLKIDQQTISTKPIKGTSPRGKTIEEDEQLAYKLSQSIKDCAENLMIVDLLRNDLGKNCLPGTVKVDKLFDIESFTTVHHLVSEISGTLPGKASHLDAFLDCFPGGSITGAPKIRAMQIIDELEPYARQIYCGSIAYFSAHGNSDSNICIRTFLARNNEMSTWAGGGIVADSDHDKEYIECSYKIESLIKSLSTDRL